MMTRYLRAAIRAHAGRVEGLDVDELVDVYCALPARPVSRTEWEERLLSVVGEEVQPMDPVDEARAAGFRVEETHG